MRTSEEIKFKLIHITIELRICTYDDSNRRRKQFGVLTFQIFVNQVYFFYVDEVYEKQSMRTFFFH